MFCLSNVLATLMVCCIDMCVVGRRLGWLLLLLLALQRQVLGELHVEVHGSVAGIRGGRRGWWAIAPLLSR